MAYSQQIADRLREIFASMNVNASFEEKANCGIFALSLIHIFCCQIRTANTEPFSYLPAGYYIHVHSQSQAQYPQFQVN